MLSEFFVVVPSFRVERRERFALCLLSKLPDFGYVFQKVLLHFFRSSAVSRLKCRRSAFKMPQFLRQNATLIFVKYGSFPFRLQTYIAEPQTFFFRKTEYSIKIIPSSIPKHLHL